MFEFATILGRKEVLALNKFSLFKNNRSFVIILAAMTLLIFGSNYYKTGEVLYIIAGLLTIPMVLFLFFIIMWITTLRWLRSSKTIGSDNAVYFRFDEKTIHIEHKKPGITSTSDMEWQLLYKVFETKEYYFLYISKNQSYIIHKDTITNGSTAAFSTLLHEKLGKKYRRK